jgi:purine-binding chemotaxis protein CheW
MTPQSVPAPGRYLTFHLGASHYAVPVRLVREVVRLCPITSVPQMPDYVRGVINLRGTVLAILDLRAKFGMASIEYGDRSCIIVFEHRVDGRLTRIGAIVDAVDDVILLSSAHLAPPPDFAGAVDSRYLAGVATTPDQVRAVLAMDEILSAEASVQLPDLLSLPAGNGTGVS